MEKLERIIEQVRRLPVKDRRRLIVVLNRSLGNGGKTKKPARKSVSKISPTGRRQAALDAFLAMAGTAHSDYTDVSTDKYRHLAEIYVNG
ncbi:MAG TPA: hypothetical protein VMW56_00465 [Candidatus Margulisiibacteriota bacterium]|nr:hypothetical protein [Candidatus Margulisiibacteriota bacterium]